MERSSRRKAIINTDAKNEADDQYAIVHALLSPSLDVRGLIAAHFGTARSNRSMEESREEIDLLLDLLGHEHEVMVANGAPEAIANEQTPMDSAGAQLIIAESKLATAKEPLFVAFLGPLTDMASAILLDPGIVHRDIVVVWIGGAVTAVLRPTPAWNSTCATTSPPPMSSSTPASRSGRCRATSTRWSRSATPSSRKIGGTSKLADYLISQMVEWNRVYSPEPIESRSLGDSPAISLMLVSTRRQFPDRSRPALRPGGSLPAWLWTSDQCRRVCRRPVSARRHVRKDSQVRACPPVTPTLCRLARRDSRPHFIRQRTSASKKQRRPQ